MTLLEKKEKNEWGNKYQDSMTIFSQYEDL